MSYAESMFSHADIEVPLDRIKPTGDCVLVRVLPEEEVTASGIVLPQMGKDSAELRIGEVIAVGPGDPVLWFRCICGKKFSRTPENRDRHRRAHICPHCGLGIGYEHEGPRHHPMHVQPGDRIWYRRVLANQQLINGELFQIIREEQHIWAVLEN